MIVNAYAVITGFVAVFRCGVGLAVAGLAFSALWTRRPRHQGSECRDARDDRVDFLVFVALVLLGLSVLSWPLFYLVLESYVPEWPGVMCIYGVARVGTGSAGPSRFLPQLVTIVESASPVVVLLSGSWFVLHILDRRTRTAPLARRILLLVLASGVLSAGEAAAEVAYLAIPKAEEFLAVGCCTAMPEPGALSQGLLSAHTGGAGGSPLVTPVYYAGSAAVVLALSALAWRVSRPAAAGWLALLPVIAASGAVINTLFLVDVATPRLVDRPGHHCPYDLAHFAPASLLAVAAFAAGGACVLWAWVARFAGNCAETREAIPGIVARLLGLGAAGHAAAVVVFILELWR